MKRYVLIASVVWLAGWLSSTPPVAAQERPHAYYVLVDTSTSMSEVPKQPKVPTDWTQPKMAEVRRQLGEFCAGLPSETEVRIFTFDRDFREGPQVTIAGDAQRDELRKFFATLQPIGNATFAWNSLNRVLGKAAEYVRAAPGARVRVLMYTDGEDNDPSKPDLRKMLSAYKDLLKNEIKPTIVTLGFTLEMDATDALTEAGVEHTAAYEPQLPLIATLDWEPRQPTPRDAVRFIDCSMGAIVDHAWDFGDGATSHEKAPRHKYNSPGEYVVRLTIRDTKGVSRSSDRKIVIGKATPLKPSAKVFPAEVHAGEPVQFVNESQGSIAGYAWAFGDGEESSEANPRHVYQTPGDYTLKLTVIGTDDERQSIELRAAVHVLPPEPPTVEFAMAPLEATVGETIQFFDRSIGLISERAWDFGDGTPIASERDQQHRYSKPGQYAVKLVARGPGGEASSTFSISVAPTPPPVARFVVGVTRPRTGDEIAFTDTSQGRVDRATWDFGEPDASPVVVDYVASGRDAGSTVRHTFTKAGKHVVTLTVDGLGGSAKADQLVEVVPATLPPKARFTASATKGRETLAVTFVNESEGTIVRYTWDFGDGSPPQTQTTLLDVDHTFGPGTHTVTLTATGTQEYAPSRFTQTIVVSPPPTWLRKNIFWIAPAAFVFAALLVWGVIHGKKSRLVSRLGMPTGRLVYKPATPPTAGWSKPFPATGEKAIEFVCAKEAPPGTKETPPETKPDDGTAALTGKLSVSNVDPSTHLVTYQIELWRKGEKIETFVIEPNKPVLKQGIFFKYEP